MNLRHVMLAAVLPLAVQGFASKLAFAETSIASNEAILARLDKLEKENRTLRDRVRVLEKTSVSTNSTERHAKPKAVNSAMAMQPKSPIISPQAAYAQAREIYSWTGFYTGAHFGVGLSRQGFSTQDPFPLCGPLCPASADYGYHLTAGVLGGLQAGYNYQLNNWVFGIEGQYSFADLKGDAQATTAFGLVQNLSEATLSYSDTAINTLHTRTSGIASVAAKLGYASDAWDRTLFYVKGGAAYSRNNYTVSETQNIFGCTTFGAAGTLCGAGTASSELSWSKDRWGWLAGIGLEYALNDNLSAMAEYNYLGFGNSNFVLSGQQCDSTNVCTPITRSFDVNENVHVIKFGINWHWR